MGLWVVVQIEDLNNPIPNCLTLKDLFDRDAFHMGSLYTMQLMNHVPQVVYMAHDTASTKSPTLQNPLEMPAAIAGVMRSVL